MLYEESSEKEGSRSLLFYIGELPSTISNGFKFALVHYVRD